MNLPYLAWRKLKARPLSGALSWLLLTMGVGIISMLLLLNNGLQGQFARNSQGIDMVIGAKGSSLQLVLSAVYQIDAPTGNIPLQKTRQMLRPPLVKHSIPLSYGDSYQSFRIVGTNEKYAEHFGLKITQGRQWQQPLEVCIGARVGMETGLKLGDEFHGSHGLQGDVNVHKEHSYKVVGIFEENGSVADQLILTDLESVWKMHDHPHEHDGSATSGKGHAHAHHHQPDEAKHDHNEHKKNLLKKKDETEEREITAMLVKFGSPLAMVRLPRLVNGTDELQAALPAIEINRLFGLLGIGLDTLKALAAFIILISGLSVFVALYNSLKDRKYEMALMRTLGASKTKLAFLVLLEGLALGIAGYLGGLLLSRFGMFAMAKMAEEKFHYQLFAGGFLPQETWLGIAVLIMVLLAALLPALQAYKTDISASLSEG